jgi:phenylpyruvate tautomerase PptA (4-oxalocrotonate tautomerase family)
MPIIYLSFMEGAFTPGGLNSLAEQVTRDAIELEKLPFSNEWVRSTTLMFTRAYPEAHVYHGGKPGGNKFVTLDINVIQGGYSAATKTKLIKRVTDAIGEYGNLPKGEPRRVYVFIREVAEANLGFDGKNIDLQFLRDPLAGLEPL